MTDWVYLKHDVTGGTTNVPNLPDVLDDFAARGWHPAAPPTDVVYIPAPDGLGPRELDSALYAPEVVGTVPAEEDTEE